MGRISDIKEIIGKRVVLKPLKVPDITQKYIDWLNDPRVNHFISSGRRRYEYGEVEQYVRSYEGTDIKMLFGIYVRIENRHIGNLTYSHIDWQNNTGAIGIAIGDVDYWGKGYASEALRLAVDYAFNKLGFVRLIAGIDRRNEASVKLFKRIGFVESGTSDEKKKYEIGEENGLVFVLNGDCK